jgi:hypothetical protein
MLVVLYPAAVVDFRKAELTADQPGISVDWGWE